MMKWGRLILMRVLPVALLSGCVVAPVRFQEHIAGTPSGPQGHWYINWVARTELWCSVRVNALYEAAKIDIKKSFIVDPQGTTHPVGIKHFRQMPIDKAVPEKYRFRYTFYICPPSGSELKFKPGTYDIHIEIQHDAGRRVFSGKWELRWVLGTPL